MISLRAALLTSRNVLATQRRGHKLSLERIELRVLFAGTLHGFSARVPALKPRVLRAGTVLVKRLAADTKFASQRSLIAPALFNPAPQLRCLLSG